MAELGVRRLHLYLDYLPKTLGVSLHVVFEEAGIRPDAGASVPLPPLAAQKLKAYLDRMRVQPDGELHWIIPLE